MQQHSPQPPQYHHQAPQLQSMLDKNAGLDENAAQLVNADQKAQYHELISHRLSHKLKSLFEEQL